ncbi:MAG TPA: DNA mismatch repair endonuclease MutL, partial [Candidatus Obscuribacter sp.]|nr:DNA mismatch repair endonuclease MutL [Candidatus Obscuribacter sp.]
SADGNLTAQEAGCAPGTVMEIKELFYNTPARLKFMKKANTEFGHIEEILQSLAISYPHVAFTLIKDGDTVLRTTGSGSLAQAVVQAKFFTGKEALLEVAPHEEIAAKVRGLKISGLMAKPLHFRGDRKGILTIVNGRTVRCPLTYKALDYVYSDLIPRGRYPLAVVRLEIDPGMVDVNIHPTKKELKYQSGNEIYVTIQRALASTLRQNSMQEAAAYHAARRDLEEALPEVQEALLEVQKAQTELEKVTFAPAMRTFEPAQTQARTYRQPQSTEQMDFKESLNCKVSVDHYGVVETPNQAALSTTREAAPHYPESREISREINREELPTKEAMPKYTAPQAEAASEFTAPSPTQKPEATSARPEDLPAAGEKFLHLRDTAGIEYELPVGWRLMGYLHNTYIFFETPEGLEIVEQHIAHERTLYEKLLASQKTPGRLSENSQRLIISTPLDLSSEQLETLKISQEALAKLGFEFSFDDGGNASVSQLPLELASFNYRPVIQKMLDDLATVDATNMDLEATKSIACQSAIKNGMPLSVRDILKLVSDWLGTERNDTCPHGRPVRLKFSKEKIFEMFHPA